MKPEWNGLITFCGVTDLEKTDQFYHQLLQLPLYKDQGLCRIYDVPGGGKLGFCSHQPVIKGEKSLILTLLTDNVDGVWEHLKKRGLEIAAPVVNDRFNIYHFFLTDPDGYLVEIQRFLD